LPSGWAFAFAETVLTLSVPPLTVVPPV